MDNLIEFLSFFGVSWVLNQLYWNLEPKWGRDEMCWSQIRKWSEKDFVENLIRLECFGAFKLAQHLLKRQGVFLGLHAFPTKNRVVYLVKNELIRNNFCWKSSFGWNIFTQNRKVNHWTIVKLSDDNRQPPISPNMLPTSQTQYQHLKRNVFHREDFVHGMVVEPVMRCLCKQHIWHVNSENLSF